MIEIGREGWERAESILMANELPNCACVMKPHKKPKGQDSESSRWMNRRRLEKNSRTGESSFPETLS